MTYRPIKDAPTFVYAPTPGAMLRWLVMAMLIAWGPRVPLGWAQQSAPPPQPPRDTAAPPTPVDAAHERVSIQNSILKLIDDVSVPAEVSGTVDAVRVREGDRITTGTLLASIRSEEVRMELRKAEIELTTAELKAANEIDIQEAEKTAAVAEAELARVLEANKRVANSFLESEVDRYRLIYERAALGVERARFEQELAGSERDLARNALEMQTKKLERYRITAPASGIVVSVVPREGEWVEAGTTVAQIVDLSRLRLEGFVDVGTAGFDLERWQALVTATGAQGETHTARGVVTFVSPEVNPVNSLVRVYVDIDNADLRLRPGLRVQAELVPPTPAAESVR